MKRVIFFVDYEWALGSIHYELCKRLWPHGYDCQVLPWHRSYNPVEMQEIDRKTDLWVTLPQGWGALKSYGLNIHQKTIIIAHAVVDLHKLQSNIDPNELLMFREIGAVSSFLLNKAEEIGLKRHVHLCPVGINVDRFKCRPSMKLETIGYGGSFANRQDSGKPPPGEEKEPRFAKRSYLAEECATQAGLKFIAASTYHLTHIGMPGYYSKVDAVIIPSLEEGAGLPALEAGAAGRLVMGTPVGHWPDRVGEKGGIKMPMEESEFVYQTVNLLKFYRDNPLHYQQRCWEILEHAKGYDWRYCLDHWLNILQ